MNNLCLYFHINPLKNEIFYVGIGNVKRPYAKSGRNNYWKNTVNKYGYIIDIIENNLSEEEACRLETMYIKKLGRINENTGPLVNFANGGRYNRGFKHTEKWKQDQKIRSELNPKFNPFIKGHIPWNKGLSKETDLRLKEKGEKFKEKYSKGEITRSEQWKEKQKLAKTGKPGHKHTTETKTQMALAKIGNQYGKFNQGKLQPLKQRINNSISKAKNKIIQKDLQGNILKVWESLFLLKLANFNKAAIRQNCKGIIKKSQGFVWEYYNSETHKNLTNAK